MTGDGAVSGVYGVVPNAFDWLIADRLAACVNPGVGLQAARRLAVERITLIVNMYERADDPELLERLGATSIHLPVPGSCAPTLLQLDVGVQVISQALERGERVAVHCGAGLGRAGTMLAAYLVSQGCAADEAIASVRAARPGSVETLEQEQAIHEFALRHAGQQPADGQVQ